MKKSLLIRLAMLLLITSTMSGCLLIPVDEGNRDRGSFDHDRGEHRGDHHDRH